MSSAGQRDLSSARLTRHALERFLERFGAADETEADALLRVALRRTRRLGRNPTSEAVAILALHGARVLVAIFQGDSCLTVLTWPQFEPRLAEFGRPRLPRKRGRMLRRLRESMGPDAPDDRADATERDEVIDAWDDGRT